jgi:hypothetical protein
VAIRANGGDTSNGGYFSFCVPLFGDASTTGHFQVSHCQSLPLIRYADVLLMRAEALVQLGQTPDGIALVNQVRDRAAGMMTGSIVSTYPNKYGVHFAVGKYNGAYSKDDALKIVKMERRLELALECERFFDLVRWGDAETVINKFYSKESETMSFLSGSYFTKNKNEYLPIPFEQMAASNGHYTQNCGEW